jgi:signal transduction histidine kinase
LLVQDSGIGMTQETIKQIFLPFFTTKDIKQGTGLGLSVVHGIVQAHGGSIDVESRIGNGARFRIKFPLRKSSPEEKNGS